MNLRILMVVFAFIAGIVTSSIITASGFSTPIYTDGFEMPLTVGFATKNVEMPSDRIKESQIHVLNDKVILDIENPEWSAFTPTKSMVPIIDTGANAIQVKPQSDCTDIEVGDIISYKSDYADGTIIHRVVGKEQDEDGIYFVAKGDNNPTNDPGKIRCDQILRVLVAIVY